MALTKYTNTYSSLTAARELDILEHVLPNGVMRGVAPFVSSPADYGTWKVSLYSGLYCIDGTIFNESTTQTGLWNLSSYSPGSGDKFFTFYVEYRYGKTDGIGPNYRFVYGSTPRPLTDRGNATYDPWSADTGHENAEAIPLGLLVIPNGATSIDHSSVYFLRARTISSATLIEKTLVNVTNIDYDFIGGRIESGNLEFSWKNLRVLGHSSRLSDTTLPTITHFSFSVSGPDVPVSFSAPFSNTYTDSVFIDTTYLQQVGGVAIVIKPIWDDYTDSIEATYIPMFPVESDDFADVYGGAIGFSDNELPYRPELEDYIVLAYINYNEDSELYKVSLMDGAVGTLSGNSDAFEEFHSLTGVSTNSAISISSTEYGTESFTDINGNIDIDNIIDNIAQLRSITLDDAYRDTASGGDPGDGRTIEVDGGAVTLNNEPYTISPSLPNDVWLSTLRIGYGGDYSDYTHSERGIDIHIRDIDPDPVDEYLGDSYKPALVYRVPFFYDDSSISVNPTGTYTIRESTGGGTAVVAGSNLADAVDYAFSRGFEVYATFTLTDTSQAANFNFYKLSADTINNECGIYLQNEGTDAPLSHFGGLASPLLSQTVKLWINKVELGSYNKMQHLRVIDDINVSSITGFNALVGGGYPPRLYQLSDVTSSSELDYVEVSAETGDVPTAGFGGKLSFTLKGSGVDKFDSSYIRFKWYNGSAPNQTGAMSIGLIDAGTDYDVFGAFASGVVRYVIIDRNGAAHEDRININFPTHTLHVLGKEVAEFMGDSANAGMNITSTEETNSNGGRKAGLFFGGEKLDGTQLTQGKIEMSHSGASNDFKSQMILAVNNDGGANSLQDGIIIETSSSTDEAVVKVQNISPIDSLAPIIFNAAVQVNSPWPVDIYGILYARNKIQTNRINGIGSAQLVVGNNTTRFLDNVYIDSQISGPSSTSLLNIKGQARAESHVIGKNTPIAWASLDWDNSAKEFSWGGSFGFDNDANLEVTPSNGIYAAVFDQSLAGIVTAYDLAVHIQIIQDIGPSVPTLIEFNHSYEITPTGVIFRIQFKNGGTWYDIDETSPAVGTRFLGLALVVVGQIY